MSVTSVTPARSLFSTSLALTQSLRPSTRLWYDVLGPLAMIYAMAGPPHRWLPVIGVVGAVVLFHGGQTLFNDVADVAVDQASRESSRTNRASATGRLSRQILLVVGWILVAASLAVALAASWVSFLVLLAALPTVLSYNFTAVGGLSGRPLATQLFWPVTWIIMYALGAAAISFQGWRSGIGYLVFVIVFMGLGEGLCQDIRDADNDKAGGRITTVVRYGQQRATAWAWASFALSAIPLGIFMARYGAAPLAASLAIIGVWLAISLRFTIAICSGRSQPFGKAMHVGSIVTFTAVNLAVLLSAALTA